MNNPWITPMWVMVGVMFVLNALQYITRGTSALLPVSGLLGGAFVVLIILAVKAMRWSDK